MTELSRSEDKRLVLATGRAHPELAQEIAEELGTELLPMSAYDFANGEIYVRSGESVRGKDVFIIQSHPAPLNNHLMEQLIMVDSMKRASARRITVVSPFYPYARQDKKGRGREPISARLVADLYKTAGASRVMSVDLHTAQIQGFFDIPVDNLTCEPSIARWIRHKVEDWRDAIIVSPDAGGAKRATSLADSLSIDFALINCSRHQRNRRAHSSTSDSADLCFAAQHHTSSSEVANGVHSLSESGEWFITDEGGGRLRSGGARKASAGDDSATDDVDSKMELLVGNVTGKTAILVDDMIDTGRTLALASKTLEAAGAKRIFAISTHGLLSGRAVDLIARTQIEKLVVTNTISNTEKAAQSNGKIEVIDMSAVMGETIRRAHHGESISTMFRQDAEIMF